MLPTMQTGRIVTWWQDGRGDPLFLLTTPYSQEKMNLPFMVKSIPIDSRGEVGLMKYI